MSEHLSQYFLRAFRENDIYEALDKNVFNLRLLALLAIPEAVAAFEESVKLPITGDSKRMIENYNNTYWTSQCSVEHISVSCLKKAVNSGFLDIVKEFFKTQDLETKDIINLINAAIKYDQKEILYYLIFLYPAFQIYKLYYAIQSGDIKEINRLEAQFKTQGDLYLWNEILDLAADNSNLDIAKYAISKGITDLEMALEHITRKPNFDIILEFLKYYPFSHQKDTFYLDYALYNLAKAGNVEILDYFVSNLKNPNYMKILYGAIAGNHPEILSKYISYASSLENLLRVAVINEKSEIVHYLLNMNSDLSMLNFGLRACAEIQDRNEETENERIAKWIRYFLELGANDIQGLTSLLDTYDHQDLANEIRNEFIQNE